MKLTFKLLKSNNKLTARLSPNNWEFIEKLMAKHEDFIISNILRRLLASCEDLEHEGIDLYHKTTVSKIIEKMKEKA